MKRVQVPLTTRLLEVQNKLTTIISDVDDLIQSDLIVALVMAQDNIKDVVESLLRGGL